MTFNLEVPRVIQKGSPVLVRSIPHRFAAALLLLVFAAPASAFTERRDMSKVFYQTPVNERASVHTSAAVETTIRHTVFSDDLDGSVAGWSILDWRAGNTVRWNIVSGPHACTTNSWWLGQTNIVPGRDGYGNGWVQQLITNVPINISGLNTARLTFKQRLQTELDYDIAWVLIKGGNAGARWDTLAAYSGNLGTACNNMTIDIADSFKTVTQPITLQFLFGSDMTFSAQDSSGAFTGWSLDDVKIAGIANQQNDVRFFDAMDTPAQWTTIAPDAGTLWHIASAPDPQSTCFFLSTNVFVPYAGNGLVPDWIDAMLISPPMGLQGVFSPNAGSTSLLLQFDSWNNLPSSMPVFWSLWISGSDDQTTWTPWKDVIGLSMSGGNPECIEASKTPPRPSNNLLFNPYNTPVTGVAPNTRYIRLGFRLRDEKASTLLPDHIIGPFWIGVLTNGIWFDNIRVTHTYTITGVENVSAVPVAPRFEITKAYPNPFNPRTTLEFSVPEAGPVTVRIFDTHGREVATLVDQPMSRGMFRAKWDGKDRTGTDVASGLYFAEIQGKLGRDTKRLTLLK